MFWWLTIAESCNKLHLCVIKLLNGEQFHFAPATLCFTISFFLPPPPWVSLASDF